MRQSTHLHLSQDEAWALYDWLSATINVAPDAADVAPIEEISRRLLRLISTNNRRKKTPQREDV